MGSSRCSLCDGSELLEVIGIVLGVTVIITMLKSSVHLKGYILLGRACKPCKHKLLQDIEIVELGKLHSKIDAFNRGNGCE